MKYMNKISLILILCLSSFTLLAQTKVKGKVTDGKEPVIGANVSVKGTTEGTVTDIDGNFELTTSQATPFKLVITMVGMATSEMEISGSQNDLTIKLSEETSILNDVVVSASRVEEKILESPVTIEKMDQKAIKTASSADYYDDLAKLKGVQTINGSMTFTAVNTRGFGGISNTRFVQLMDGMDNAAPLLNFPTGNIVGIGELDINNMELVPGASSALYGPNAFNGILLMNSKNPFEQPGFSAYVKAGFAQAKGDYGIKPMGSGGIRFAHAFKCKKTGEDYLAIKGNFNYFQGTDWFANDYTTDRINAANTVGAPNFDGLNTYGDEYSIPLLYAGATRNKLITTVKGLLIPSVIQKLMSLGYTLAQAQAAAPGIAQATATSKLDSIGSLLSTEIKRTGFKEEDLLDNSKAQSVKGDFGVYFRPFKDKSYEFSYNYRIGYGSSVYQGSERYALRNFSQQFHKVEIKGRDFFIRSYLSQTHDGDSYNLTALGTLPNEINNPTLKPDGTGWAPTYYQAYVMPFIQTTLVTSAANTLANGATIAQIAHDTARAIADRPWTSLSPEEKEAKIEAVRNGLFQRGGAGFIDNSRLIHTEAMIDLSRWTKKALDIQIGGNHRMYSLSTQGTVFNEDPDGTGTYKRINIHEAGAFIQLQRKFYKDMFRIQASVRWDKNQNFKSIFSPRAAFVVTLGKERNHNIRVSYQTGFRNPDSQAQYIYFPTTTILLGGTKANAERYGIYNGGAYTLDSWNEVQTVLNANPLLALRQDARDSLKANVLKVANFSYVKPENLQVVELGYKAILFKKLLIDVNGYFNIYKDFIGQLSVVNMDSTGHKGQTIWGVDNILSITDKTSAPTGTRAQVWRPYANLADKVFSYGAGIGLAYMLPKGFMIRASYNFMDYKIKDAGTSTAKASDLGFNASKHQVFVGVSGNNVWKGLGFGVDYRWQSAIDWSSDFADGTVKSRGILDANVSYFIEKAYTTFKVGATNIAGPEYRTNVGGPFIGRTFYVGVTFDQGKMWKEHHAEVTGAKEF